MSLDVLHYTAFTDSAFGGNPAGVVLDATGLDNVEMQAIAAEVGYSESAFLTPGDHPRSFGIRYFSPKTEVPFCGHATVAAAVALAERIGSGALEFATPVGPVPVDVSIGADGVPQATLTSVPPQVSTMNPAAVAEVLRLLNWRGSQLDLRLPPRIAFAGARHLVLATRTRQRLADLSYDFDAMAAFMTKHDLVTLQLVWRESSDTFHARNPFPVGGVVEDPATGAAAAALGGYLRRLGQLPTPAEFTIHQGHDMGRPSRLKVELRSDTPGVRVTGQAVAIRQLVPAL